METMWYLTAWLNECRQMIPSSMKYNAEGSAPSFSETEDAGGMTVERGSQVRLRIKGIRGELGQMFAIGSIREDYLGYVDFWRDSFFQR